MDTGVEDRGGGGSTKSYFRTNFTQLFVAYLKRVYALLQLRLPAPAPLPSAVANEMR